MLSLAEALTFCCPQIQGGPLCASAFVLIHSLYRCLIHGNFGCKSLGSVSHTLEEGREEKEEINDIGSLYFIYRNSYDYFTTLIVSYIYIYIYIIFMFLIITHKPTHAQHQSEDPTKNGHTFAWKMTTLIVETCRQYHNFLTELNKNF